MAKRIVTISDARASKDLAKQRLSTIRGIVGIGLTRRELGYAVKINLDRPVKPGTIPQELNGVPIVTEVVGHISRQPL
jgi:hypothetical protein